MRIYLLTATRSIQHLYRRSICGAGLIVIQGWSVAREERDGREEQAEGVVEVGGLSTGRAEVNYPLHVLLSVSFSGEISCQSILFTLVI